MRLRYTGSQSTVFNHPQAGAVAPGDVFWVDDADADVFLARADVEPDGAEEQDAAVEAPRTRKRKTPDPAPEPDGDDSTTPADAQSI